MQHICRRAEWEKRKEKKNKTKQTSRRLSCTIKYVAFKAHRKAEQWLRAAAVRRHRHRCSRRQNGDCVASSFLLRSGDGLYFGAHFFNSPLVLNSYVNVLRCCQSGEESGRATVSVVTSLHGCVKGCQFVFGRSEGCCVISILAPSLLSSVGGRGIYSKTRYHVIAVLGCFFFLYISCCLTLCRQLQLPSRVSSTDLFIYFFHFACEGCSHFRSCCLWLAALGSVAASPDFPRKSALSVCSRVV